MRCVASDLTGQTATVLASIDKPLEKQTFYRSPKITTRRRRKLASVQR